MNENMELDHHQQSLLVPLTREEYAGLREVFQQDNKEFVRKVDRILLSVKRKEDIDFFLEFIAQMRFEVLEVAPFLSNGLNKIFIILIKNNFYKQVAEYSELIGASANIKVLELLNTFVKDIKTSKFLSNMEMYKIKKLVFDLSSKFKKKDIAYKIQIELEGEDINWLDSVER